MEAHVETLGLLDLAVAQGHSLETKQSSLSSDQTLQDARAMAVDAAALAIARGGTEIGVRLLEQGRNIIFRQFGQLRTQQLKDVRVVAPELAEKFTSLSRELETLTATTPVPGPQLRSSGRPREVQEQTVAR